MAEEIGVSVASKIAELLVEPIIHQFRYAFCFNNFAEEFKEVHERLICAQDQMQNKVNEAKNNAEEIEKIVDKWMKETDKEVADAQSIKEEIQQDKGCFNKLCPNWLWRYRLSNKLAKKTETIKELLANGNFTTVSHRTPSADIEFLLPEDFTSSESSRAAFRQIMEALKDDGVNKIGLYGMGGVGKTTLVKEVADQAKKLKLFNEVVMVVVSQTPDFIKIQDQIAKKLGLQLDEQTKESRASKIWQRLEKTENKTLVILDDIWKKTDLKDDVGIPCRDEYKCCKVLLTTRQQHLCHVMLCQRKFQMNPLTDEESWALFKKNTGLPDDDDSELHQVAMEVMRECDGLPIAIVTVGSALRGKTDVRAWRRASKKLKQSKLLEISDVPEDNNAYACLKLSFDYLQREETKSCLLLCALFPEDFMIFEEDLVSYALGLGLYTDAQTVEDVRDEVLEAIDSLKNFCMLLETERKGYVKMHDMVRDFTLWIGSHEEKVFTVKAYTKLSEWQMDKNSRKYKAISIMDNDLQQFPDGLFCPNLEMLLVSNTTRSSKIQDDFFREMKQLKVVSLVKVFLSTNSLGFLTNVQVLELTDCQIDNDFGTILPRMKGLQILRLHSSSPEELSNEVGELENLRVLDLKFCKFIVTLFPTNKMRQTLQSLEEVKIESCMRLQEVFQFQVADEDDKHGVGERLSRLKKLELNVVPMLRYIWKGSTSGVSLKNLTTLTLSGVVKLEFIFSPWLARSLLNLQRLYLLDCRQLKHIIPVIEKEETILSKAKGKDVAVTHLKFSQPVCLPNLVSIEIEDCPCLEYVFPISIAHQGLPRLEKISIWGAYKLKNVFENEEEEEEKASLGHRNTFTHANNNTITTAIHLLYHLCSAEGPIAVSLPSLQNLTFWGCPNLLTYSIGKIWTAPPQTLTNSEHLFGDCANNSRPYKMQLRDLSLDGCDELEQVIAMDEKHHLSFKNHSQTQPSLQCFSYLQHIGIFDCNRLKSLFPIALITSGLPSLREVMIVGCSQLVQLFDGVEDEVDKDIVHQKPILFLKLEKLGLQNLPNLINFCPPSYHFIFPSLKNLSVEGCSIMTTSFTIATNKSVHLKTKAPQEASSSTNADIDWPEHSELPLYLEDEIRELQPIDG